MKILPKPEEVSKIIKNPEAANPTTSHVRAFGPPEVLAKFSHLQAFFKHSAKEIIVFLRPPHAYAIFTNPGLQDFRISVLVSLKHNTGYIRPTPGIQDSRICVLVSLKFHEGCI